MLMRRADSYLFREAVDKIVIWFLMVKSATGMISVVPTKAMLVHAAVFF